MPNTIRVDDKDEGVVVITLARPDVHNAFNQDLVKELTEALEKQAQRRKDLRVLVLRGEGKTFCAGADLNWMKSMVENSEEDNLRDSMNMAQVFRVLNDFPRPVVVGVQGAAMGGGVGLVACADVVIAEEKSVFAFPEVRLGIVPGVISPYVIEKIGAHARALFLTGERFSAEHAFHIGLVHKVVPAGDLNTAVKKTVVRLLNGAPGALWNCKEMIRKVEAEPDHDRVIDYTTDLIAKRRVSPEGQEGMKSFLAKKSPSWMPGQDADVT